VSPKFGPRSRRILEHMLTNSHDSAAARLNSGAWQPSLQRYIDVLARGANDVRTRYVLANRRHRLPVGTSAPLQYHQTSTPPDLLVARCPTSLPRTSAILSSIRPGAPCAHPDGPRGHKTHHDSTSGKLGPRCPLPKRCSLVQYHRADVEDPILVNQPTCLAKYGKS